MGDLQGDMDPFPQQAVLALFLKAEQFLINPFRSGFDAVMNFLLIIVDANRHFLHQPQHCFGMRGNHF